MKISALFLSALFLFAASVGAQEQPPQRETNKTVVEQTILRVEGEQLFELTVGALAKLPRRTINVKDHDTPAAFEGVELREVLKLAGVKLGNNQLRGKEMANFLLVAAADGYTAVFALAELDADFTDKTILLADKRDGKLLSKNEGALRLVVPDDKKHGRWVRQVVALRIKRAE